MSLFYLFWSPRKKSGQAMEPAHWQAGSPTAIFTFVSTLFWLISYQSFISIKFTAFIIETKK